MKKVLILRVLKIIVKHLLPIIFAYFEGDTHLVEDSLLQIF